MSKNNTIYKQKSNLDQFYTRPDIAKLCYDKVWKLYSIKNFDLILEPCAGTGSFYNLFPKNKRAGLDLDPHCIDVIQMDFFNYIPNLKKNIIVISNPPFGRSASIAVKFFNKAAEFSSVISFIVPKTFRKQSIQNKLDMNFHLKFEMEMSKNSFIFQGKPYGVPCIFQIWEKQKQKRVKKIIILENEFFSFVKKSSSDFAVRRVGGTIGKVKEDLAQVAEVSHYFLKVKLLSKKNQIIKLINSLDFTKVSKATAGVKSISKQEFVEEFMKHSQDLL